MHGGDLLALGAYRRCLPPVQKVVAGAGYFAICLADYSIRMTGDAPAAYLEPRWKFSDLLAMNEIPGATAFLWANTYLQFWNRDKRRMPDGVISAGSLFATRLEDRQGGTGAIAWYTREGLEATGLEAAGGSLYKATSIHHQAVNSDQHSFFFPASAFWPVWPGQSTVSVRRKTVQVHLIGAKPIVQVKK